MPKNDRIPAKEGPVGELASGQEVFLGDELDLGLEIQVDGEWILSELRLRGTAVGGPKPSIERPQGLPPTTLTVMPKDPLGQPGYENLHPRQFRQEPHAIAAGYIGRWVVELQRIDQQ